MFNLTYKYYYSNADKKGFQGVGLLIIENIDNMCSVENIPNFKLNRALGINLNYNNNTFKLIGVHLKSLYDQKITKDEKEQVQELSSVIDWIKDYQNVIICGDFNNIPGSKPINYIKNQQFTDVFEKKTFVNNILNNTNTEFHRKNIDDKEQGSRIDYIFTKGNIKIISSHIINIQRECIEQLAGERCETSDHLPIMAILSI
jgi:endonuclease/exonuclease/phosphatase family metal-dependent hydrolase